MLNLLWTGLGLVVVGVEREERGLSQQALAKKADGAQGYISSLEAGERKNPSIAILNRISKALGVPVTELLE